MAGRRTQKKTKKKGCLLPILASVLVNELAKDLNIPVSEITDVVQEYFGVQKKSQASLSEDEASVLMSMGMMMLPPTTISLPFKILLFVLADGWDLVIKSLVQTFY